MEVKKLTAGDGFKQKGQRKFRTVASSTIIPDLGGSQPKEHVGKMLIVDTDCHQWIIDPETEIQLFNPFI